MKKVDKTKVALWCCSIFLLATTVIFYLKWKVHKSIFESVSYVNKNFDSLNASGYFTNNIDMVSKIMLFKIKRARKLVDNNEIKTEDDLGFCKNMMDGLKVELNENVRSINDTIKLKFRSNDTIAVYSNTLVVKTHNIKLKDAKDAFYSILDSLEYHVRKIKK
jgi:hypothetical protein